MANVNVSLSAWPGSLFLLGIVFILVYVLHMHAEMAAEVKIIIPSIGQNNSRTFVVQTYN